MPQFLLTLINESITPYICHLNSSTYFSAKKDLDVSRHFFLIKIKLKGTRIKIISFPTNFTTRKISVCSSHIKIANQCKNFERPYSNYIQIVYESQKNIHTLLFLLPTPWDKTPHKSCLPTCDRALYKSVVN